MRSNGRKIVQSIVDECLILKMPQHLFDECWVSASSTYNYMMKDPLLDWLNRHHQKLNTSSEYSREVQKCIEEQQSPYNFTSHIFNQGKQFESRIIDYLTENFTSKRTIDIHGELNPRDPLKVQETIEAMKKGVPFIHSGVLHDEENKTFGIPDLLVRSDWLKYLVDESPLENKEEKHQASKITKHKWHYRVVDIKFTTLLLRADGKHLLNANGFPAYKVQLYIYNRALGKIQGYQPNQTYILGRRWQYISHGITYKQNSCFDKLGIIDYSLMDSQYIQLTDEAVKWVREVNDPTASQWNITKYPLERWELYPNMCNSHDGHWHKLKQKLADKSFELTNLWMIGPKNRTLALEKGISSWKDKRCTASMLGVNGERQGLILDEILKINRQTRRKISPSTIINNYGFWQNSQPIEFFVDFETTNGAIGPLDEEIEKSNVETIIFMIGVGYYHPGTKRWIYQDFTVNQLTLEEEYRICHEFASYVYQKSEEYNQSTPKCFHWSNAEYNLWLNAVDRHPELLNFSDQVQINWIDLLIVFKEEPIVIKNCMSFGLKDVAKAMYQHGMIKTTWDNNSQCSDGLSAMIVAYRASEYATLHNTSMNDLPLIKDIIRYNEVDVKVLAEIVSYLRSYHLEIKDSRKRKSRENGDNRRTKSKILEKLDDIRHHKELAV